MFLNVLLPALVVGLLLGDPVAVSAQHSLGEAGAPPATNSVVGCVGSARTATRHPVTGYDTFARTRELLNVYEGDRVVFYSPEDLQAEQYSCILTHLDSCMEMYSAFAGGAYPRLLSPEGFEGKGSLALVENTCGAGCGTSGRAEVLKEWADRSVSRVGGDVSDPRGWQVSYYEMGRGTFFPFYPALLLGDHVGQDGFPQWVHEVGSGFPHFMAHACMHSRGVSYEDQEAHFRRWEHHFPHENPPPHIFNEAYRSLGLSFTEIVARDNPELTLDPDSPPTLDGRRGVNHVFSMILTDLYREYGALYVESWLEDLAKMDAADSAEAVEQNMLDSALSAYYAANSGGGALRRLQSVWRMNPDWRPTVPTSNLPPVAVGTLLPLRLGATDAPVTVDVASAFRDPEGDALTYGTTSSSPNVVSVSVFWNGVTVTPVAAGTSSVQVTATDPDGLSATQSFTVRVCNTPDGNSPCDPTYP